MLVWTNPYVMTQVLVILVLVVLPTMWFGRRVRRLSRASQDRVADSSAIAAEVLNAIPVVQSYAAEAREARALRRRHRERLRHRACAARGPARCWWPSSSSPPSALLLWGLYQGTQAVLRGQASAPATWADGGVRDHPGRRGGGAGRGLRRPAARGRRHRAADGAAGQPLAGRRRRRSPCRCRACRAAAQRVRFEQRHASTTRRGRARRRWRTSAWRSRRARRWPWSGPAAPARARCSSCCCASTTRSRAASCSTACRCAQLALHDLRARIGIVPQDAVIFSASALENIRYGRPEASDEEVIAAARGRLRARLHRARCPRATTPSWASAACACRAASASASRSRARC